MKKKIINSETEKIMIMFLTKYTNKIQVTGTLIKTEEKYFFFYKFFNKYWKINDNWLVV